MMGYIVAKTHLLSGTKIINLKNTIQKYKQIITLTFKIIILIDGLGLLSKTTSFSASNILSITCPGTQFEILIKTFLSIENKPSIISLLLSESVNLNFLFPFICNKCKYVLILFYINTKIPNVSKLLELQNKLRLHKHHHSHKIFFCHLLK